MNLAAKRREQEVISRTLNEEIEAQIGDSTNVDMTDVLPRAYFNAARRIAALGSAQAAQQLYQAGMQTLESTTKYRAELDHLKAETDDLNEAQGEFLETTRQRDALTVQAAQFAEGTPTGDAVRRRVAELDARLAVLNERGVNTGAPPREIVLGAKFEADREANNGQPGAAEQVWRRERMTAKNPQSYALYVEQGGKESYESWTPTFEGQINASQTLGGEGMKSLFDLEGKAQEARASLQTVKNSLNILNEGIRTGPLVDARQYIARGVAEFFGDSPDQVTTNTDAYLAAAGPRVLAVARALAPVTELDLTRVEQIVGAGLTTSPEALREVLKIVGQAQGQLIERYNKRLSTLGEHYLDVADAFAPIEAPQIDFSPPRIRIKVDDNGNVVQ